MGLSVTFVYTMQNRALSDVVASARFGNTTAVSGVGFIGTIPPGGDNTAAPLLGTITRTICVNFCDNFLEMFPDDASQLDATLNYFLLALQLTTPSVEIVETSRTIHALAGCGQVP